MKQSVSNSLGLISIVFIFLLSNSLAGAILVKYFEELSEGLTAFLGYGAAAAITVGYTLAIKKFCNITVPSLKPEFKRLNPRLIVLGFILIIAMGVVIKPLIDLFPEEYMDMIDGFMATGLWAMITAVILAPIFEEYIFRGVIQGNLINRIGAIKGIVIGAAIFGIVHIIPQQAINAFGVGLIIGSIYYITGSLNTVIAIHFINNGFAYLLFLLFADTYQLEKILLENPTVHIIAYASSLIILILGATYVIRYVGERKVSK